jgi:hypothetical protein
MRSRDVVELFDEIPMGASVKIIAEHLPRLRKYEPPKPVIIAARPAPPTPAPVVSAPPAAAPRIAAAKTTPVASIPPAARLATAKTTPPKPGQTYEPSGLLAPKPAPAVAAITPSKKAPKDLPEIAEGPRKLPPAESASSGDAGAFAAMKGSILFAGLPEGPAPKSISTSESKKLLHSAPLTVAAPADGLSLNPSPSLTNGPTDALFQPPEAPGHLAVRNPSSTPPAETQ